MTAKPRNTEYTISSGNVFADVGFAEPDTELIKADLVHAITTVIEQRELTQVEAADLMGIKQPNVSLLLRGRTENYSVGRLITLLNRLGHDVVIAHREKPRSQRVGRTRVGLLGQPVRTVAEQPGVNYRSATLSAAATMTLADEAKPATRKPATRKPVSGCCRGRSRCVCR